MAGQAGTHLDIGCGMYPRNPYDRTDLVGIDLHDGLDQASPFRYMRANLSLSPIPFEANTFDSISAFDFIEHVPRQLAIDGDIVLPFIRLMNEVWRVLKPGGLFYAVTPAYPSPAAFQDPTHVNIITTKTHEYFCGPKAFGRNYGFVGDFEALRVKWVIEKNAYKADESFRKNLRQWHRRVMHGRPTHLLWELKALK
jgi:SAM-dependent methyltransferase